MKNQPSYSRPDYQYELSRLSIEASMADLHPTTLEQMDRIRECEEQNRRHFDRDPDTEASLRRLMNYQSE